MFLVEGTDQPEGELATRRSYNRWLADRCEQTNGRLRWICLPTTRTMDKAIDELRFAKDHGACGVLKKGNQQAEHWPNLIVGSDFTHADPATEPEYLRRLRERVDSGEISETLFRKMTEDNPRAFYGL